MTGRNTEKPRVSTLRVIATIPVYNEADIVGQVLNHLCAHRVCFVVLDGGSEDGSIEIARGFDGKGLLEHKIVRRDVWRYREDLDCLIEMAAGYSPDWIVYNDADEFLEPRESGQTLFDAIAAEDRLGFKIIQFDNFEFCLTERDCESKEPDIRKRMRFYRWVDDYRYKAWKYYPGTTNRDGAGHFPVFPRGIKPRVSPRKFVMRHYPFRSPEQAVRKVFVERLPRYAPEERAIGWHGHHDHFKEDWKSFVVDSALLSEFNGTCAWPRTDWNPNEGRISPTSEYLFGRWSGERMWLRGRLLAFLLLVAKIKSLLHFRHRL